VAKQELPKVEETPKKEVEAPKPKTPKAEQAPKQVVAKETAPKQVVTPATPESPGEEKIETKYQKLSGATFTGQKIDLKQFERPAKKKEEKKDDKKAAPGKPQGAGQGQSNDPNKQKSKRKRIKPGTTQQPAQTGGGAGAGKGKPDFNKGKRAPIIKVEPTEEEVKKQIQETLEK